MRLFESFRAQQNGVESPEGKSVFNRFLHFGPLCGPPVEMTKAQILIAIGINRILLFLLLKDAHSAAIRVRRSFGRHVGIFLDLIKHVFYCGIELRIAPVDH